MPIALITGVTGQDGAYLAEFLIGKGYEVHGLKRRSSLFNTERIEHLYQDPHEPSVKMRLHFGDMTDAGNLIRIVQEVNPDEIYNLAAQSHVQVSFELPEFTAQTNALGTLRILEAIRILRLQDKVRFFQASTSEMYGDATECPQDEATPFQPCSPYGIAKVFAYWTTVNYRNAYGIHACNGILFNHESPVRGETFVTRKIARGLARIKVGLQERLYVGNLEARRDWGHARDFVEGMWLAVQHRTPDDYVFATGQQYSVRELIELAAAELGFEITWRGEGANETGVDRRSGRILVEVDPRYFRPTEVNTLCGNAGKARARLGWQAKVSFKSLIREMVRTDYEIASRDSMVIEAGYQSFSGR